MTRWLNKEQQKHWRAYLAMSTMLEEQLSRELQAKFGITITDYEIMVRLSESENREIRMSELADQVMLSRSRLSHQIDRMVKAGFVTRQACADDRRGQLATLTDVGFQALVDAAPAHVAGVREHFVDLLTDAEYNALGLAAAKVAEHLDTLK